MVTGGYASWSKKTLQMRVKELLPNEKGLSKLNKSQLVDLVVKGEHLIWKIDESKTTLSTELLVYVTSYFLSNEKKALGMMRRVCKELHELLPEATKFEKAYGITKDIDLFTLIKLFEARVNKEIKVPYYKEWHLYSATERHTHYLNMALNEKKK